MTLTDAYLCTLPGPGNMPAPDPDAPCCLGSASTDDGTGCTCWVAVLDPARSTDVQEGPHPIRARACHDCASRPGSPERTAAGGDLPYVPWGQRFYCHDGMPRAVGYTHPQVGDGTAVVPSPVDDDYRPAIRGEYAWQADGAPAILCAGWAAHTGARRQ